MEFYLHCHVCLIDACKENFIITSTTDKDSPRSSLETKNKRILASTDPMAWAVE